MWSFQKVFAETLPRAGTHEGHENTSSEGNRCLIGDGTGRWCVEQGGGTADTSENRSVLSACQLLCSGCGSAVSQVVSWGPAWNSWHARKEDRAAARDGRGDGSYVEGTVRNTLWVKGHVTEKREARTVRLRGRTQRLPGQQKSTWSWRNQKGSRAAAGGWGQRAQGPLKEADRG